MTWLIDAILWVMVAALAAMAHARGPVVLRDGLRVGTRDFLGLVPRVGLGVVGAGFIAAAIPEDIIVGLLGPGSVGSCWSVCTQTDVPRARCGSVIRV